MHDLEGSWHTYTLLEAFADGYGGWRVVDVLGKPVVDLPESQVDDLLTWRSLVDIAREEKRKQSQQD